MNNFNCKKSWINKIDKLLFLFASFYLMTTLGWFWKQKQHSNIQNLQASQAIAQKTVDNNQLLNNQSIDVNQINQNKPKELILSIPLPEAEEISNQTIKPVNTSNLQTSSSANSNSSNISLPPLPPPPSNLIQQNPQPISSPSSPKKIVSSPKKLAKVPTINSLNQPSTENQTTNINQLSLESSSQTSKNIENIDYTYSLVGAVQLPNSGSFALFKINDITEKVPLGSEIGTSGWVLMSINGNQAVVSRENKSINIRVGESF